MARCQHLHFTLREHLNIYHIALCSPGKMEPIPDDDFDPSGFVEFECHGCKRKWREHWAGKRWKRLPRHFREAWDQFEKLGTGDEA